MVLLGRCRVYSLGAVNILATVVDWFRLPHENSDWYGVLSISMPPLNLLFSKFNLKGKGHRYYYSSRTMLSREHNFKFINYLIMSKKLFKKLRCRYFK